MSPVVGYAYVGVRVVHLAHATERPESETVEKVTDAEPVFGRLRQGGPAAFGLGPEHDYRDRAAGQYVLKPPNAGEGLGRVHLEATRHELTLTILALSVDGRALAVASVDDLADALGLGPPSLEELGLVDAERAAAAGHQAEERGLGDADRVHAVEGEPRRELQRLALAGVLDPGEREVRVGVKDAEEVGAHDPQGHHRVPLLLRKLDMALVDVADAGEGVLGIRREPAAELTDVPGVPAHLGV